MKRVCDEIPPSVDIINPLNPAWLAEVISGLMSKQPDAHPGSATAVAELLERQLYQCQSFDAGIVNPASPQVATDNRWVSFWVPRLLITALCAAGVWLTWVRFGPNSSPNSIADRAILPRSRLGASKPSSGPFFWRHVGDTSRPCTDLNQAITDTASDEVIELAFDGPRVTSPVVIHGKALTLRARSPYRPQLINRSETNALLSTDAPLTLEGIEFRTSDANADERQWVADLQVPGSTTVRWISDGLFARAEGAPARPVLIESRASLLTANRCRFVTSVGSAHSFDTIGLVLPEAARFNGCEFYSLIGSGIRARFPPRPAGNGGAGALILVTNCLMFTSQPIAFGAPGQAPFRIMICQSTITGIRLLSFRSVGNVEVTPTNNVIACRHLFSFGGADRPPDDLVCREGQNILSSPLGQGTNENWSIPQLGAESRVLTLGFAQRIGSNPLERRLQAFDFQLTAADLGTNRDLSLEQLRAHGCVLESVGPAGRFR